MLMLRPDSFYSHCVDGNWQHSKVDTIILNTKISILGSIIINFKMILNKYQNNYNKLVVNSMEIE